MSLDFPSNPAVGQGYQGGTDNGSWIWNDKGVWKRGAAPTPLDPVLTALVPNAATTDTIVEVMALGSDFETWSVVQFDNAPMATTFVSASELRFTAPESATPKIVQVSVTTDALTSGALNFEYTPAATSPPVLVGMTMSTPPGYVGPYDLVLDGFSFDGSAVTLFDGIEKGVTAYDGSYRLYCTINVGVDVISGTTYQVSVRTGQGTSNSLPLEVQ